MANDTIGYQTINDRTSGWGQGYGDPQTGGGVGTLGYVDPSLQPVADATPEATDDRADRLLNTAGATVGIGRLQGSPLESPDTQDRSHGFGGVFDPTGGADHGYRDDTAEDIWDDENATIGTDSDVTYTGSAVEYDETSDSEFQATDSTGRTAEALPTSDVGPHQADLADVAVDYTVGSIVDRTGGWGHNKGSQTDRKHGSGDAASDISWADEPISPVA